MSWRQVLSWEVIDGRTTPGAGKWLVKIDVSPEFQAAQGEDDIRGPEFIKVRDAIVEALVGALPLLKERLPEHSLPQYNHLVTRLKKARALSGFDNTWNALYDWADAHNVWINTF